MDIRRSLVHSASWGHCAPQSFPIGAVGPLYGRHASSDKLVPFICELAQQFTVLGNIPSLWTADAPTISQGARGPPAARNAHSSRATLITLELTDGFDIPK